MQLDRITKPSVVLPTNGSVISYSLVRRMRLELTRANAHYPLNCASGYIVADICEFFTAIECIQQTQFVSVALKRTRKNLKIMTCKTHFGNTRRFWWNSVNGSFSN